MEIAYSSLLIVLFLMPGAVYITTVFSDPEGKLTFSSPFEFIYKSLIPSIFFHCISIAIIYSFVDFSFRLKYFQYLFENNFETFSLDSLILGIIIYVFFVLGISKLFSIILRGLIFRFRLDLKYNFLKFRNEFFYAIYGYSPLKMQNRFKPVFIVVSLELKSSPNKIYEGILLSYSYSKDGLSYIIVKVNTIILNGKRQKKLSETDKTYFDFQNIQNISFTDYAIEIDEESTEIKTMPNTV